MTYVLWTLGWKIQLHHGCWKRPRSVQTTAWGRNIRENCRLKQTKITWALHAFACICLNKYHHMHTPLYFALKLCYYYFQFNMTVNMLQCICTTHVHVASHSLTLINWNEPKQHCVYIRKSIKHAQKCTHKPAKCVYTI